LKTLTFVERLGVSPGRPLAKALGSHISTISNSSDPSRRTRPAWAWRPAELWTCPDLV
jgi:hypothetical protein